MNQAWTDLESHLAITCASAPALKVFFTRKLKSPLNQAWLASRSTLTRSRSRASSAKPLVSWPSSRQRRSGTTRDTSESTSARHFTIEVMHEPSAGQMEHYRQDVEKFPLEQIVHVGAWKPLPVLPDGSPRPLSPGWRSSGGGYDGHSTVGFADAPVSSASSGEFLPIYISGSLPPKTRRK